MREINWAEPFDKPLSGAAKGVLANGVWDSVITNTENGSNKSPRLSWEPVEGASSYVVYMVDTSANNWLHWRSENLTVNALEQGSAPAERYAYLRDLCLRAERTLR